jgi:hypothetical protein
MSAPTTVDFAALRERAHEAGMAAGLAARPAPMVVVQHENPFDETSPIVRQYAPIMDGVCGFAWVNVKGNTAFGRYLRKQGYTTAYGGGYNIRCHEFGQSYERKYAYAAAYAGVLKEAGIAAYPEGRLD